jgi:sporulation protein YlmC with PRC-barrel domain
MNRLLTGTAVGLLLGLTPALAQTHNPTDETQAPPAVQAPAMPGEIMRDEPSEPAAPIPDESSEMSPQASPDQSGESAPPPQTTQAPKSISPEQQATAPSGGPQFLSRQDSSSWLASDLLGRAVVNANNETIGDVDNLVTDENGKIIAVVIGAGGFLGLGEKEVAVRFEDLELSRDENNKVTVMANINEETLASAPEFKTLQDVAAGADDGAGEKQESR